MLPRRQRFIGKYERMLNCRHDSKMTTKPDGSVMCSLCHALGKWVNGKFEINKGKQDVPLAEPEREE